MMKVKLTAVSTSQQNRPFLSTVFSNPKSWGILIQKVLGGSPSLGSCVLPGNSATHCPQPSWKGEKWENYVQGMVTADCHTVFDNWSALYVTEIPLK